MGYIGFVVLLALAALITGVLAKTSTTHSRFLKWGSMALWIATIGASAFSSIVTIGQEEIGHLKRIYLGDDMKPGQIIAFDDQKGPQARILGPGFHFIPFVNVLFQVEGSPVVTVPPGKYGLVTAKDGDPLSAGAVHRQGLAGCRDRPNVGRRILPAKWRAKRSTTYGTETG
ncbi:MAG: hypothetical protein OEU36_11725 [Gammaproteobacteria bacterium]|nr:hypothetical protein [Gammaproteobacteria bacterium]